MLDISGLATKIGRPLKLGKFGWKQLERLAFHAGIWSPILCILIKFSTWHYWLTYVLIAECSWLTWRDLVRFWMISSFWCDNCRRRKHFWETDEDSLRAWKAMSWMRRVFFGAATSARWWKQIFAAKLLGTPNLTKEGPCVTCCTHLGAIDKHLSSLREAIRFDLESKRDQERANKIVEKCQEEAKRDPGKFPFPIELQD